MGSRAMSRMTLPSWASSVFTSPAVSLTVIETDVEAQIVGQAETLRGDSRRLKTGCFDFDEIFPRQQVGQAVETAVVGRGGIHRLGCRVNRPHARADNDGVAGVGDAPHDGAGDALGGGGGRDDA